MKKLFLSIAVVAMLVGAYAYSQNSTMKMVGDDIHVEFATDGSSRTILAGAQRSYLRLIRLR